MPFEGRVFLLPHEHETYLRRMPVRYVKHPKATVCCICGLGPELDNPLENSHKVPFGLGVKKYKLTPDWLDSPSNIVSAHKRLCNKAAEMTAESIENLLAGLK